ncbi:hypothetical protein I3760_11G194500 [Carya illinoinensis]|uniref:probable WRKY transcription factor 20 isoform X4 n=1 Tax=Carya illinoinensis TaxID=32201 RepID=UPI001BF93358|nr:probable WRKY transcription factor 20 isoform X4 [Carya illinoinensis]KAG2682508.1 hypothetical protein I3760_11G194500 [Carya illinoinensis]
MAQTQASSLSELRLCSSTDVSPGNTDDPGLPVSTSAASAKYKLMSPAKLPISRSACITIPPGLSPTSFLESPVLLSYMKAEPSPTTGSFVKTKVVHGAVGSATHLVPADLNHQRSEQSMQVQAPIHMVTSVASAPAEVDSDDPSHGATPNTRFQASQLDPKGNGVSAVTERSSEDGYNWRKYGQKLVKGSEFPRSYYKCTHPNCEVKKLFERSHDGQITEIIYKGTHDHPKPQPSRRYTAGTIMTIQEERSDKAQALTGQDEKSAIYGQMSHTDPNGTPDLSPVTANDDSLDGVGSIPNRINDDVDDDDLFSKRRKMDIGGLDVTPVVKPIREPRVVVQTLSEVDILDDGYRWRKYGQKVVRGNPNPRSYYKCTNAGCPVRKHVERASHDPKAVITTYEGKHNHDVPTARTSSHDTAGPTAASGPSRIRSEGNDAVSLDLGVGISSSVENRYNEHRQTQHSEILGSQTYASSSHFKVVQATPVSTYFGVLNSDLSRYGSRENPSERRNIEISPLNHSSYPFPQNLGKVLTGP